MSPLDPERSHTKIVATLGPASEERVEELIRAGLSVARLNFSHGTREEHARRIGLVRAAAERAGREVGLLADLPGPKMRVARFPGGGVELEEGALVDLASGAGTASPGEVRIEVEDLLEAVLPGHRIALADGQVLLFAEQVAADRLRARVTRGGFVGDRKGVHLPDSRVRYELPTPRDRRWIEFAVAQGVDMLGISFVGRASEVETVRSLAPGLDLVAKIERKAALENLEDILRASDGLMVARGDLGVELELEELPLVQKSLLGAALRAGRFTITATEMLESMVRSSRPTRAEVSDVANAVLDGTDAIMLSAETAVGEHPVEAVRTMRRIARAVERSQRYSDLPRPGFRAAEPDFSNAVAMAAAQVSEALELERIVCFTETGNTVRQLSRYRPAAEIVALSPNLPTVRKSAILANVRPLLFPRHPTLELMLGAASRMLLESGLARKGQEVVFVAGVPPGIARTNVLKLHRIEEQIELH